MAALDDEPIAPSSSSRSNLKDIDSGIKVDHDGSTSKSISSKGAPLPLLMDDDPDFVTHCRRDQVGGAVIDSRDKQTKSSRQETFTGAHDSLSAQVKPGGSNRHVTHSPEMPNVKFVSQETSDTTASRLASYLLKHVDSTQTDEKMHRVRQSSLTETLSVDKATCKSCESDEIERHVDDFSEWFELDSKGDLEDFEQF